jgi:hypothetical protein
MLRQHEGREGFPTDRNLHGTLPAISRDSSNGNTMAFSVQIYAMQPFGDM